MSKALIAALLAALNGLLTGQQAEIDKIKEAIAIVESAPCTDCSQTFTPQTGAELQKAINDAAPGDTIKLKAGVEYVGNFTLPIKAAPAYKVASEYITIMTDTVLPEGRINRDTSLAIIKSSNSTSAMMVQANAHHWKFVGVRFNGNGEGDIVRIGMGTETDVTTLPHDIWFDRIVIHGPGSKRGISMNGNAITVENSVVYNVWRTGQDNQTMGGWNTAGPITIRNNYLESGGEVVMFGGDVSRIKMSVQNVLIEGNDITRPIEWKAAAASTYTVKNLLELKMGVHVVIRNNRFSNNWPAAQSGWAILFTPRNNMTVEDILFENNEVRNVAAAINISGSAYEGTCAYVPPTKHITVRNNLFVVSKATMGGQGWFLQIGGVETDDSSDFVFESNTIIHDGNNLMSLYRGSYQDQTCTMQTGKPIKGLVFRNNISRSGIYGIFTEGSYGGLWGAIPDGIVTNNVLADYRQSKSLLPGNFFPTEGEFEAAFTSYPNGDYTLLPTIYPGIGRR